MWKGISLKLWLSVPLVVGRAMTTRGQYCSRENFPSSIGNSPQLNGSSHIGTSTAGSSVRTDSSLLSLVHHIPGDWHCIYGSQLLSVHSWKELFIIYLLEIRPSFMRLLVSNTKLWCVWVLTSMLECHCSAISQQSPGFVFLSLRLSHITYQSLSPSSAPLIILP